MNNSGDNENYSFHPGSKNSRHRREKKTKKSFSAAFRDV